MYQAERWHEHEQYFSPMYVHSGTGLHIHTGDFVTVKGFEDAIGKVAKFYTSHRVINLQQ